MQRTCEVGNNYSAAVDAAHNWR